MPFVPPVPTGIKAEYKKTTDREYILITWDAKAEDDTLTQGYKIYWTRANDTSSKPTLYPSTNELPLAQTTYEDFVGNAMHSYTYGYGLVALAKFGRSHEYWGCYKKSETSELVYVSVPSSSIAGPDHVDENKINDKQTKIFWDYPYKKWDHAGFRIYMDGKLLVDTNSLGPNSREYVTPELSKGRHYFIVKAVTNAGIESRKYNNCETSFLAK